jgi:hypothetical protein
MSIDKDKIVTQDELPEEAPIDQVEDRVEAEMDRIEGRARERVAQGLDDDQMEQDAREQKEEAEKKLQNTK